MSAAVGSAEWITEQLVGEWVTRDPDDNVCGRMTLDEDDALVLSHAVVGSMIAEVLNKVADEIEAYQAENHGASITSLCDTCNTFADATGIVRDAARRAAGAA